MTRICIVTDDTADLSPSLLKYYNINMISLQDNRPKKAWTQDFSTLFLSNEDEKIRRLLPHSSVGSIVALYQKIAEEHPESIILSLHLSSRLSRLVQQAMLAQNIVRQRMKVVVVDTLTTSCALGYLVLEAAKAVQQGATLGELLKLIEEVQARLQLHLFPMHSLQISAGVTSSPIPRFLLHLIGYKQVLGCDPLGNLVLDEWCWQWKEPTAWFLNFLQTAYPKSQLLYVSYGQDADLGKCLALTLPQFPLNPHLARMLGKQSLAVLSMT